MADNTDNIEAIVGNIPGLDLQASTLRKHPALLLKGLKRFNETHHEFESEFLNAYNQNDFQEATRLAHSLKGLAATFGALGLSQTAFSLEKACRDNKTEAIESLLSEVVDNLQNILTGIKKIN